MHLNRKNFRGSSKLTDLSVFRNAEMGTGYEFPGRMYSQVYTKHTIRVVQCRSVVAHPKRRRNKYSETSCFFPAKYLPATMPGSICYCNRARRMAQHQNRKLQRKRDSRRNLHGIPKHTHQSLLLSSWGELLPQFFWCNLITSRFFFLFNKESSRLSRPKMNEVLTLSIWVPWNLKQPFGYKITINF